MIVSFPAETVIMREGENKAKIKDFCRYFDKQFAKYNATGSVDAVSFDKKG